jgi:branched-chain amino acid transport system substrate-binding protein
MFRRTHAIMVAVSLVVALVIAGCSSGGGSSPSSGSSTNATSIPVGVIGSYSGPEASYLVGVQQTIQAWADSVAAAGGIDGHKIQLYQYDDGGSTETAIQDVHRLIQQDHVVAIVGENSTADASWGSYAESQGVPVVGGDSIHPVFLSNPDFYAPGADYVSASYAIVAQTAAKGGNKELGALYCAELPVCSSVVQLFSTLGKQQHVTVNYQGKIAQGTPDFTSVCEAMKAAQSTYFDVGITQAVIDQIFNQCASEGIYPPIISLTTVDTTYLTDPAFNHLVEIDTTFPFWQDNTPATKAFHAALAKYAPTVGASSTSPLTSSIAQAWTSGKLFEAAVKAAGSGPVTAASVKKGLYALKNETLGGLTGPLNYKPGQPNQEYCTFSYEIENGKFVGLNGLKPTCASAAVVGPVAAAMTK